MTGLDLIPGAQRAHLGYELGQNAIQEARMKGISDRFEPLKALERQITQSKLDPRSTALYNAGVAEDVADLGSAREADRYFSPGQKGIRADTRANEMAGLTTRYLQPAQLDAESRILAARLGLDEATVRGMSQEQSAALRALGQLLSGQYGADIDDPRVAPFAGALGFTPPAGAGAGGR